METTLKIFFNDASALSQQGYYHQMVHSRPQVGDPAFECAGFSSSNPSGTCVRQHNNSITTSLKIKINNKYMKTFTQDDLVRFVYNETSQEESSLIKKAIMDDMELAKTYQGMLTSKEELDGGKLNPSDSSINIILNYSRRSSRSKSLF